MVVIIYNHLASHGRRHQPQTLARMRVMGYDYAAYQKQYVDNAAKYKTAKSLTEEEYLSKMKKDDRLVPVITVVVYYGEKPWDAEGLPFCFLCRQDPPLYARLSRSLPAHFSHTVNYTEVRGEPYKDGG